MLEDTDKLIYNDHRTNACLVFDRGILNVTQSDAMAKVDQVLHEGTTYGQGG